MKFYNSYIDLEQEDKNISELIKESDIVSLLYELLMNISNDVQKIIDEKGFADQMLIVARKI